MTKKVQINQKKGADLANSLEELGQLPCAMCNVDSLVLGGLLPISMSNGLKMMLSDI